MVRAFDPLWEHLQQTLWVFIRFHTSPRLSKKPQCGLSGKMPLKSAKPLVYQSYTLNTDICVQISACMGKVTRVTWRPLCSPCFIRVNLIAIAFVVNVHTHRAGNWGNLTTSTCSHACTDWEMYPFPAEKDHLGCRGASLGAVPAQAEDKWFQD